MPFTTTATITPLTKFTEYPTQLNLFMDDATLYLNDPTKWVTGSILPNNTFGRINNPLFHLSLKNNFTLKAGVGAIAEVSPTTKRTYVDRYGIKRTVGSNTPRFGKYGYIIEPSSTNLAFPSDDFTSANYEKIGITPYKATTEVIGPDATTYTYNKLVMNSTTGYHYLTRIVSCTAGSPYTHTYQVRKCNYSTIRIDCGNDTDHYINYVAINFDTKSVITSSGTFNVYWAFDGSAIVSVTCTPTVTSTSARLFFCDASGNISNIVGNGTQAVYATDCQIEPLPHRTSHIPTSTASIVRDGQVANPQYLNNLPPLNNGMSIRANATIHGHNTDATVSQFCTIGNAKQTSIITFRYETGGKRFTFLHTDGTTSTIVPFTSVNGVNFNTTYRLHVTISPAGIITTYCNGVAFASAAVSLYTGLPTYFKLNGWGIETGTAASGNMSLSEAIVWDYEQTAEEVRVA